MNIINACSVFGQFADGIIVLSTGDKQAQWLNRIKLLANQLHENVVRPPPHL